MSCARRLANDGRTVRVAGSRSQDHPVLIMCAQLRVRAGVLATAILMAGGAACAEQRQTPGREEAPADTVRTSPEAAFRAQIGRTWELTRLGHQEIPAARTGAGRAQPGRHPGRGSRPTLHFTSVSAAETTGDSRSLRAGGWSFCNGYGMAYVLGPGDQLGFRHFESTLVGCDGPDSLETRYFRALANTRRFEIDAATLSLLAADGSRLTFVATLDSASQR